MKPTTGLATAERFYGRLVVQALTRAFNHPYIKLDAVPDFDNLVIDELERAFRRGYASRTTFRALARFTYLVVTKAIR